jgi:transcriptional accessory protein Tex/SPT6
VTAPLILAALAKEFSIHPDQAAAVLAVLDQGHAPTYVGRFRRAEIGELSESLIRRLDRRRKELEELDRRRATVLRLVEASPAHTERDIQAVHSTVDRFELEDLLLPHRKPELEVQFALDRGLGGLAELLTAPQPKAARESGAADAQQEPDAEFDDLVESDLPAHAADAEHAAADAAHEGANADGGTEAAARAAESADAESMHAEAQAHAADAEFASHAAAAREASGDAGAAAESESVGAHEADAAAAAADSTSEGASTAVAAAPVDEAARESQHKLELTVKLARLCAPFVQTDRGVHSDQEALNGAMRILGDKLGRDPRLRAVLRRLLRREGVIHVRPAVEESRLGRHKPVVRLRGPLRQLQGARLLALRQAQRDRVVHVSIQLDRQRALAKVRQALGVRIDPDFRDVLDIVAAQALDRRLLPMLEEDVRTELKERADEEVLRSIASHLRSVLLTPAFGPKPVAGLDVNARGDWTIALVAADGSPVGAEFHIEMRTAAVEVAGVDAAQSAAESVTEAAAADTVLAEAAVTSAPATDSRSADAPSADAPSADAPSTDAPSTDAPAKDAPGKDARAKDAPAKRAPSKRAVPKDAATLGAELAQHISGAEVAAFAVSCSKAARPMLPLLRAALASAGIPAAVMIVNDAGMNAYSNSELARKELAQFTVPARMAVSYARRLQDPLAEFTKVDPRHLGLGPETGLVTKAALKRVLTETVESAVAFVGCDVNRAPESMLRHVPGLGHEGAAKLIERRNAKPFESREELRASGVLSDAQWTSAIACLRVPNSPEALDNTGLHPEQYDVARRMLEAVGGAQPGAPGLFHALRGLQRSDFGDIDEATGRDLLRELSNAGRDARLRLIAPRLLPADTDPKSLSVEQVVEGLVTNVAGFAAFVDIGLERDAMIHISELSERYVRDAREVLAIGQWVRARIVETGGQRIAVSLRNVPERQRPAWVPGAADGGERGPRRFERGDGRGGEARGGQARGNDGRGAGQGGAPHDGEQRRGRGPRRDHGSSDRPNEAPKDSGVVRAAQTRRDGMVVGSGGRRGRGGPGGAGGAGGARGGKPFDRRGARDGGDDYDPQAIRERSKTAAFNPFATFFKKGDAEKPAAGAAPDSAS